MTKCVSRQGRLAAFETQKRAAVVPRARSTEVLAAALASRSLRALALRRALVVDNEARFARGPRFARAAPASQGRRGLRGAAVSPGQAGGWSKRHQARVAPKYLSL